MASLAKIGLYLNAGAILRNPGYLETLRRELNLNVAIIGFSGELPPRVLALSPYDGAPPSDDCLRSLLGRHIDGHPSATRLDHIRNSAGPHMHVGGDDAELREAIGRAHGLGIDVWLLGGAWTANDFDVAMFCPSREAVNRWYEAVYIHMAGSYGVEGLDITHARYPMTSYPRGMFICTCEACARSATEMGYDMGAMTADILDARRRLAAYDGRQLAAIGRDALGLQDVLQLLGMRAGVLDWFRFRCELLARNLRRFRSAVHAAGGKGFIFGADTYPASLAAYVGHDLSRWDEFSDFASPLVSHVDIFSMQTLVEWASFLRGLQPALSEAEALRLIYRLVGYDGLAMPDSIAAFALGEPDCEFRHIPLKDLVLLDLAKAALYLPRGIPSYPIIQGGGAPWMWPREIIEGIMAGAAEQGHRGIMLQGTRALVDFPLNA
jgi:hypothetical protein